MMNCPHMVKHKRDYALESKRDRNEIIGSIYDSNKDGKFKIIGVWEERAKNNVKLYICEFIETGYQKATALVHIKAGKVKDRYSKGIYGVGYLGGRLDAKNSHEEFSRWRSVLNRLYHQSPIAYRGVTMCDRWHNFSLYLDDVEKIVGYNDRVSHKDIYYAIDKDILNHNNKVYSLENCCFVPMAVNQLFININSANTTGYEGVQPCVDGVPQANITFKKESFYLGRFNSYEDAYESYHEAKLNIIKHIFKDGGEFDYVDKRIQDACYKKLKHQYNDAMIRNGRHDEIIDIDF